MDAIGFIGLGVMGQPMALNLRKAGQSLLVWSRTPAHCEPLRAAGATVAVDPAGVFHGADTIIVMLFDEGAIDAVLARVEGTLHGKTIVSMSSVAPGYSRALAATIERRGGRFVEAPVSGSRVPAEQGQLLAMLGGDEHVCDAVRPLLAPMCKETIYCGAVGNGMLMKLAINIFMLTTAVGLAEAFHFAERNGLPLDRFQQIADASQMSSQLSRIKLAKLIAGDFARQGAVIDGVNNTKLITDAAHHAGASAALITDCRHLFNEAFALGLGDQDMIAVIRAIEARSRAEDRPGGVRG